MEHDRSTRPGLGEPTTGVNLPPTEASWRQTIEGIDVLFGEDRLQELGTVAHDLEGRRVLLVADPGISEAGYSERARLSLEAAGLTTRLFDQVEENPTSDNVAAGVSVARALDADLIVGIGGGSAMDCAKGINILLTNGGRMSDYQGFGRTRRPLLPSIGVPTTAGTGSEAQSFALITDPETHSKMACGDAQVRFRAVILDPALTDTLPRETAAAAGLDAIAHALESYVTTRRCESSNELARVAWESLDERFEPALDAIGDRRLWGEMQIAAFLAGAAIERSMLGAAHALANPITSRYGTTHGIAVALMLPHVIRYNGPRVDGHYAELVEAGDETTATETLAQRVEALRAHAGMPGRLREAGVSHDALPSLAEAASRQWTLGFNPRPAQRDDLVRLYETAY